MKKSDNTIEGKTQDVMTLDQQNLSRRKFLKVVGVFTITATTAPLLGCNPPDEGEGGGPVDPTASLGYIVVDSSKCQGCLSCMITCSLANEGYVNLSKSRIQVVQSSFKPFPDDTIINQCHQCEDHPCVDVCPVGALHIDEANGNLRVVDESKCVGCGSCHNACPFTPERPNVWLNANGKNVSHKCDLCLNAPYHFAPEIGGGVEGIQNCVAVCPLDAIQFTTELPDIYDTNSRAKG